MDGHLPVAGFFHLNMAKTQIEKLILRIMISLKVNTEFLFIELGDFNQVHFITKRMSFVF